MINFESLIEKIEQNIFANPQEVFNQIENLHPPDIAYLGRYINQAVIDAFLVILLQLENLSEIVTEFDPQIQIKFIEIVQIHQPELIKDIFDKIEDDDVANILASLSEEVKGWVASKLNKKNLEEAELLLSYPENSAGRIMTSHCFYMLQEDTLEATFNQLRKSKNSEMIYYIYVVDQQKKLVGVVSLRDLLTKQVNTQLKEIMKKDLIYVSVDTDQEEVAQIIQRYNLSAVPVVNTSLRIQGMITVDDIIDVIQLESTEDMMKHVGMSEKELQIQSTWHSFITRIPWLLVAFIGGLAMVQYIDYFSSLLPNILLLAFIPIITGMGGNIGNQAAIIIVRGLATGKIISSQLITVLMKELLTAILLGLCFGSILFLFIKTQHNNIGYIAYAASVGVFASMLIAALIGSIIPIFFDKINIDPAVATGPLVATLIDNLGLLSYLIISIILFDSFGV